jgi:hypothetical protein
MTAQFVTPPHRPSWLPPALAASLDTIASVCLAAAELMAP